MYRLSFIQIWLQNTNNPETISAVGFGRDGMLYPDGLGDDQVIIFARFIFLKKKVETFNTFLRQSLINVTFPG